MQKGKFITFEGGEGAGKSTQCQRLFSYLKSQGIDVILTREPGGALGAERIRSLLVEDQGIFWDGMTEVLLQFAARRENLCQTVWPALEKGTWVISDRFADSTFAYQGGGWGVSLSLIQDFYERVVGDFKPDLTFLIDLPVEVGLERAKLRAKEKKLQTTSLGEQRYESLGSDFHTRVRRLFLERARQESQRFCLLEGTQDPDSLEKKIRQEVDHRFFIESFVEVLSLQKQWG